MLSALVLCAVVLFLNHNNRAEGLQAFANKAAAQARNVLATAVADEELESELKSLTYHSPFELSCVYRASGELAAGYSSGASRCPPLGEEVPGLKAIQPYGLPQGGIVSIFYHRPGKLSDTLLGDFTTLLGALLLIGLLLAPLSKLASRKLIAPIGRLTEQLRSIQQTNRLNPAEGAYSEELAELYAAFTELAQELEQAEEDAKGLAHRRSAEQLTERVATQTLRDIIDLVPFYIFTQRADGSLVYANQATADLFDLSPEEMLDPTKLDAMQQFGDGAALLQVSEAHTLPSYNEEIWLRGFGEARRLKVSRVLFSNNKHQLVIAIDVTEEHRLQTQLQFSQRLEVVGTLAGGIAHDFNNLLTPIIGYTSLLRQRGFDEETEFKLDAIATAAEKARHVVKQILAFSRQQPDTNQQPTDVNDVVDAAAELMRASVPSNVRIHVRHGEIKLASIDSSQLEQVLVNLCTNATQAIGNGHGLISIETSHASVTALQKRYHRDFQFPEYVCIRVQDTGDGMSAEILEHIFEPFYTTKEVGRGTGLGLSVAHGIVQSHRGEILASSTPQEGSCFEIVLPLSGVQVDLPKTTKHPISNSARVMVVDDEAAVVQVTSELLRTLGHRPTPFTDPLVALKAFRQDPGQFDLLLTDERMPGISGTELARAVRELDPHFPILMMTGFSEDDFDTRLVDERLLKPMTGRSLTEKIEALLRKSPRAA